MSDYTGDPDAPWDTSIEITDDSFDRDATSLSSPIEAVIDRTEYLKQFTGAPGGGTTVSLTKILRHAEYNSGTGNGQWSRVTGVGAVGGWLDNHTAGSGSASVIFFALDVPHGATLTQLRAYIDPASHAILPAQMPKLTLYRQPATSSVNQTNVAEQDDTSASTAVYNAAHLITLTVPDVVIDHTSFVYGVAFLSEADANSETGLKLLSVRATFTIENGDPRGS